MILPGLKELDLSTNLDYAYLLEAVHPNTKSFKVNIPRIMPLIPQEKPKTSPKIVNSSILVNADACKPKGTGTVSLNNYIIINMYNGVLPPITRFSDYKSTDKIAVGARILCMFVNHNIDDIHALL